MARYQVILVYDGTHFFGFQRQGNARTVQLELETALQSLGWEGRSILAAGRTDSGVHAAGQVVVFDLDWKHPVEALRHALNAHLPPDVAVKQVFEVGVDFHPRFDACWRTYHYLIYCESDRNPLLDRYAWRVYPEISGGILTECALLLPGVHDFTAAGTPPKAGGCTLREVFAAKWEWTPDRVMRFIITANAFLYHMVRRLVFLQVLVAQNRMSFQEWSDGVQKAKSMPSGMAPANGLTLIEVGYTVYGQNT